MTKDAKVLLEALRKAITGDSLARVEAECILIQYELIKENPNNEPITRNQRTS